MKVYLLSEDDAEYLEVFDSIQKALKQVKVLWEDYKNTYPNLYRMYRWESFFTITEKEVH